MSKEQNFASEGSVLDHESTSWYLRAKCEIPRYEKFIPAINHRFQSTL